MTLQQLSSDFWAPSFPRLALDGHKYNRGHTFIVGARALTGATRLAAEACARMGAGLVTVLSPAPVATIYRTTLPAHILIEDQDTQNLAVHTADTRRNVIVLGCGLGADPDLIMPWAQARTTQAIVWDAGALRAMAHAPDLRAMVRAGDVCTPHTGELEGMMQQGTLSRADWAQAASDYLGCTVLLKGAGTVVCQGQTIWVCNIDAPYLATAGTGDVLAGMIAGLLAQGMAPQAAAAAATYFHAKAGEKAGIGLVASDIQAMLPALLGAWLAQGADKA